MQTCCWPRCCACSQTPSIGHASLQPAEAEPIPTDAHDVGPAMERRYPLSVP